MNFDFNMVELVGYLASALLMISFMMKDVMKLRMINSFGCACFVIYGFMLATSWPIIITNAYILFTNIWHLLKSFKKEVV